MKVNLGAAGSPREGWDNYDLEDFDVCQPWPFTNSSITQLNADCLLPHLPPAPPGQQDPLDFFMGEAARCMSSGAEFTFTAPDWRYPDEALTDVYHYRLIGPRTFYHYHTEAPDRPLGPRYPYFTKPIPTRIPSENPNHGFPVWKRRFHPIMRPLDLQVQWSMYRTGQLFHEV